MNEPPRPFGWELRGDGYVQDLRAPATRPQRGPGLSEPASPRPCVLLVGRAVDREFALVERLLESVGTPVARLDAETAAGDGLAADLDRRTVRIGGRLISPTVTWIRHFSPQAMTARRSALARAFAADSWRSLADQLSSLSAEVIPGSGPGLIDQLTAARAAGLTVPRTAVSTDPAAAARRLGSQKVIIKALHQHFVEASPGLLSGVFPEIAQVESIRPAGRPRGIPVVVQEYVPHEAEIRCYYVRGQILTFAVEKADPMAPWLAPKAVKAAQVDPPPLVVAATLALANAMSVRYGAFDFLIAGGTPVFLELNWAGDWRWIETRARVRAVTVAVTAMLHELHHNTVTNALSAEPGQQQGRIDLIRFLSGGSLASPS